MLRHGMAVLGVAVMLACTASASVITIPIEQGTPGSTVIVPVDIDVGTLTGIIAIDLQLSYDTTLLDLANSDVKLAGLTATGWTLTSNVVDASGTATIGLFNIDPLVGSPGQILELDFHIPASVTTGSSAINITATLNESAVSVTNGQVTVVPEPAVLSLLVLDFGVIGCRRAKRSL